VALRTAFLKRMRLYYRAWEESLNNSWRPSGIHTGSVENAGLYSRMTSMLNKYWLPMVRCFVCNNPEVQSCIALTTQDTINNRYIILHTKNARVFQLNLLALQYMATGHKEGTIDFPQGKPLTRSIANSTVSSSAYFIRGWDDLRSRAGYCGQDKDLLNYCSDAQFAV
jgi:hypothetical protein